MKTKLLILSCLMVCSSFFYQAYANPFVSTNLKFTYTGPSSFPDADGHSVTASFEGSDWTHCLGARVYLVFSKTPDFDLTNPSKVFYKHAMGRFPRPEKNYGVRRSSMYKIVVSSYSAGDYNIGMNNSEKIPDGEYYVAALITAYYNSKHSYIVVKEKSNKKVYIGKKPAPPVQTCDVEVTKFEINFNEVTNYTMLGGSVTVKLSGINSVDAYVTARLLTSGGAASELLLGTNPRVKLTQGTQNLSLLMQPCIPAWDKENYKYIEVKIDADCKDTNYNNNSKKISAPKIIKTQSYSALRSLDNTDNNDQTNISELYVIWNNPEQSAVKVSLDEKYIGKEIYIVNVTRNAFVAKQKITATELSVSIVNAVRKGDLISIYVNGTEQASKLLKTN